MGVYYFAEDDGQLKRQGSIAERRRSSVVPPLDMGESPGLGEGMQILEESPEVPMDVLAGGGGEAFETVSRGRLGSLRF
jgi:hypothetical protein